MPSLFLIFVLCFSIGILTAFKFFFLSYEAVGVMAAIMLTLLLLYRWQKHRSYELILFYLWFCSISILIGMGCVLGHAIETYEKNPLTFYSPTIKMSGIILSMDDTGKKAYVIVKTKHSDDARLKGKKWRMTIPQGEKFYPHDHITVQARFFPLPKPAFEGDYDWGFVMRMQGVAGIGNISKILDYQKQDSQTRFLYHIRYYLAEKIRHFVDTDNASIIISMLTGERAFMNEHLETIWRESGIYHILSISGLHMSVIAGIMFFIGRRFIFIYPPLAQRFDSKKIAAIFAILMTFFYMLIAGGSPPVMRSFLTIAVMLGAILYDRPVFSVHNLMLAYCFMLFFDPMNIFHIGFGLSFSAVLGMLLLNQMLHHDNFQKYSWRYKIIVFLGLNFVASYAGFILALSAFGTVYHYNMVANLVAIPMTSFLIMPLMVCFLIAIPFELEAYPLKGLDKTLDFMNNWAEWIVHLPHHKSLLPLPHASSIFIFYIGLYLMAILKNKHRLWGAGFMLTAWVCYLFMPLAQPIWVQKQKIFAFLDDKKFIHVVGKYHFPRNDTYLYERLCLYFGIDPKKDYYLHHCGQETKRIFTTNTGQKFYCNALFK